MYGGGHLMIYRINPRVHPLPGEKFFRVGNFEWLSGCIFWGLPSGTTRTTTYFQRISTIRLQLHKKFMNMSTQ